MPDTAKYRFSLLLLQVCVAFIFVGRAYQAIFHDISMRALFWDRNYMEGIVWLFFGWSWDDYASSVGVDVALQRVAFFIGLFWVLCGVLAVGLPRFNKRWVRRVLRVGTVFLVFLHLFEWKDKFLLWGQLLEHAAQASAPLLLIYLSRAQTPISAQFIRTVKIIIALTFFCHGLFAVGWYPVPAPWIEWCISVFGFSPQGSLTFLFTMGILDFVAAFLLFVRPLSQAALWYCIVWGFLTALARIVANFYPDIVFVSLHQWWHETAFRLIHGGLPLALWFLLRQQTETQEQHLAVDDASNLDVHQTEM